MRFILMKSIIPLVVTLSCVLSAPCSTDCAEEFLDSCVPYHCSKGTANPYSQCRTELDNGSGPIADACGGESGCTDTAAMAEAASAPCGASQPPAPAPSGGSCKEAGTSSDGTHIRIVGDSLLSGTGVQSTMAPGLDTRVVNCAKGGASLTQIAAQTACSMDTDCAEWSIVSGGRNGAGPQFSSTLEGMTTIVNRERAAGLKVIIFLYSPDAQSHDDPNSQVNQFQNEFYSLVDDVNVLIYDPRLDPELDYSDPNSRKYRGQDDSHPSPLGRQYMGTKVAELIKAQSISSVPVLFATDAPVQSIPSMAPAEDPISDPTSDAPTGSPTTESLLDCNSINDWSTSVWYKKDDQAVYEGMLYQALKKSNNKDPIIWSTKPKNKQNKWELVLQCASRAPTASPTPIECSSDGIRWDKATAFKIDDVVFHEGYLYKSIKNGKNKDPVTWSTKKNPKQNRWSNMGECQNSFTPTTAPSWNSDDIDCLGPFPGHDKCERKIKSTLTKDSAWFAFRGMDGSRCSIQQWYSNPARGQQCPLVVEEDCVGPFPDHDDCEKRIQFYQTKKDSQWFAFRDMDGSRCSIQQFLSTGSKDDCPSLVI